MECRGPEATACCEMVFQRPRFNCRCSAGDRRMMARPSTVHGTDRRLAVESGCLGRCVVWLRSVGFASSILQQHVHEVAR